MAVYEPDCYFSKPSTISYHFTAIIATSKKRLALERSDPLIPALRLHEVEASKVMHGPRCLVTVLLRSKKQRASHVGQVTGQAFFRYSIQGHELAVRMSTRFFREIQAQTPSGHQTMLHHKHWWYQEVSFLGLQHAGEKSRIRPTVSLALSLILKRMMHHHRIRCRGPVRTP